MNNIDLNINELSLTMAVIEDSIKQLQQVKLDNIRPPSECVYSFQILLNDKLEIEILHRINCLKAVYDQLHQAWEVADTKSD